MNTLPERDTLNREIFRRIIRTRGMGKVFSPNSCYSSMLISWNCWNSLWHFWSLTHPLGRNDILKLIISHDAFEKTIILYHPSADECNEVEWNDIRKMSITNTHRLFVILVILALQSNGISFHWNCHLNCLMLHDNPPKAWGETFTPIRIFFSFY